MKHKSTAQHWSMTVGACWLLCSQWAPAQGTTIFHTVLRNPRPDIIFGERGIPLYGAGAGHFGQLPLDFNQDGAVDYNIYASPDFGFELRGESQNAVYARPAGPHDINNWVVPLTAGAVIGPDVPPPDLWSAPRQTWLGPVGSEFSAYSSIGGIGLFRDMTAYAGVRFDLPDGVHYGWILLQEIPWLGGGGIIYEYAYETHPGVPIKAGAQPVPVPLVRPRVVRPGYLRLKWRSEIGKAYQVQTKARLDAFAWSNLSFVLPATSTTSKVDLPMSAPAQFFRVVEAD